MELQSWINGDESAKDMLARVLTERPFLLLPPLHRVPLRVGNVVEIVGASASAKTEILIQAAISCILPKEWKGAHYGGLERLVMYIDLDCRFDILRLSQSLKLHIMQGSNIIRELNEDAHGYSTMKEQKLNFDRELFVACMKRFLYVRCYNSFEFLATLKGVEEAIDSVSFLRVTGSKTLHYRLQKESQAHGVGVHFLMIDSIGAFYWVDRASTMIGDKRKNLSLQSVVETAVQEIQRLLMVQPMLVLATKATIFGDEHTTSDVKTNFRKWSAQNSLYTKILKSNNKRCSHREYMPSVWQVFVTHRILVQVSDIADREQQNQPIYVSEWLLPSLDFMDRFTVGEAGVLMVK